MLLTFLEADVPLSKSYALDSAGRLSKTSYPHAWQFTSHAVEVEGLAGMAEAMIHHADLGHCLLKGNTLRQLIAESRAGSTDSNLPTLWGCADLDRLPGLRAPGELLDALEIGDPSFVCQFSSAFGIETDRGLTAHLMLLFKEPQLPSALKLWLMWKNLTVPMLRAQLQLTKTNTALSWPLDITTCQNDKLLYIAPPQLGPGIEAPDVPRIEFVERSAQFMDLGLSRMPPAAQIKQLMETRINELREEAGLGARKFAYKVDKTTGIEVMSKADAATMTGLKRDRGFVYFNLNNGDSWGYYHPEERPEVIRNFKGEPDYLTSELLPDYWATVQRERKDTAYAEATHRKEAIEDIQQGTGDKRILVFRDFETGTYWNGEWDGEELVIAQAKSETQIQHWLKAKGLPEIDFIPIWNLVFDPHSDVRVDFAKRRVNMWAPTPFMRPLDAKPTGAFFPVISKLIEHAVGTGKTATHFLNWLAFAFQYRKPALTAWVLHGVQGTGKGLLVYKVLAPLFGMRHVVIKRMEELEDQFNGYLESALIVVVDEAQISDSKKSRMIMANLKNQITEPMLSVRKMRTESRLVPNYTCWLFLSNMPDPVMIDASDRRFNVGTFQREMLTITDEEIAFIDLELPVFAAYLQHYPVDQVAVRTVMQSEERDRIIATSRTSAELVAEALTKGMLDVFWEELPSGATDLLPIYQQMLITEYTNIVHAALNGKTRFSRDELRVLFEYLCGDMPRTPTKFTQLLRHRNIHLKMMRIEGKPPVRGLEVEWHVDEEWLAARRAELALPRSMVSA